MGKSYERRSPSVNLPSKAAQPERGNEQPILDVFVENRLFPKNLLAGTFYVYGPIARNPLGQRQYLVPEIF